MAIEEESFYNIVGEEINRTNLVQQMINYYALKLEVGETRITDFNEGSEIRNLLESIAVDLYYLMEDQNELSKIAFVDTAEGEWLDKHGANPFINLPRDTGSMATGYVVFSIPEVQTTDIVIPEETIVVCEETGLEYSTDNEIIIPVGDVEATASVTCLTEGVDGNCSSGSITLIEDDYLDIPELSVTNLDALTGGTDYEEDDEYRERLLAFLRKDDFGSIGYYQELGDNVDGVHDVALFDATGYTKKVLVNGDSKPTPDAVLADVLEVYTSSENIVIGHNFTVDTPEYITVSLTVNLGVEVALSTTEITNVMYAVFDGGSPVVGMDFDGLGIGETLFKSSLVSALELFDAVVSVNIIDDDTGEEFTDLSVNSDEVLQLTDLTINQTIIE